MRARQTSVFWVYIIIMFSLGLLPSKPHIQEIYAQTTPFLRHPSWNDFNSTRRYSSGHDGIDFQTSYNPVVSSADGTIQDVIEDNNNLGCNATFYPPRRMIFVSHANTLKSVYAHLSAFGTNPRTGQRWAVNDKIFAGEILGNSGHSGCTYGAHLHFAIDSQTGTSINPDSPMLWSTFYPDAGFLESPSNNSVLSGIKRIEGWTKVGRKFNTTTWLYDPSSEGSIDRVELWLLDPSGSNPNPRKLGNAIYGGPRADVGGNYGWYFDWNTISIPNGTYFLQPRAFALNGSSSVLQGGISGSIKVIIQNSTAINDYNNDGKQDIYGVAKDGTQSGQTEVHILNGADNFQSFLLHTSTALHRVGVDATWAFTVGDYNADGKLDLYGIAKDATQSGYTEVHILNGADNFQTFLTHQTTALHRVGVDTGWVFDLGDYNADGRLDLYGIAKDGTQSGQTEVHVLDGADNFQTFLVHARTNLHKTGIDGQWMFNIGDYNDDGKSDLYAIAKDGTGSKQTEIHILNGVDNFQTYLTHAASALGESGRDCQWDFVNQCVNLSNSPLIATGAVNPTGGGEIAMMDGSFQAVFPTDAVTSPINIVYEQLSAPIGQVGLLGQVYVRDFSIRGRNTLTIQPIEMVQKPYTVTLAYNEGSLGVDELSLQLAVWNTTDQRWTVLDSEINSSNNTIMFQTTQLNEFALFGRGNMIFLPNLQR